jgi:hypothetical protein
MNDSALEKEIALNGLNIRGYADKFNRAKELVSLHIQENRQFEDDRHLLPFWERVRLCFLELGGEYLKK